MSTKKTGLPKLTYPQMMSRINAILSGRASLRYPLNEIKTLVTKKPAKQARGGRVKKHK